MNSLSEICFDQAVMAPEVSAIAQSAVERQLVGRSAGIRRLRDLIQQVAAFDSTVLVLGESGTGKELVARAIHDASSRRDRPFVPVNCGAIPAELLESELFGHEKGAFTGALNRRHGRFELASGGTLFLDEIGDMPLAMQVKLLRVIQERCFERVGGSETLPCDVRIIAATHCDLEHMIEKGQFREDLFYRINVFPLHVPPLRERVEDLPLLMECFLRQARARGGAAAPFSEGALAVLARYRWPGNVRELVNLVERMGILNNGREIRVEDLPERYRQGVTVPEAPAAESSAAPPGIPFEECGAPMLPESGIDVRRYLANIEIGLIRQALEQSTGTISHAADLLGLRRTTLTEKMKKYGLEATDF